MALQNLSSSRNFGEEVLNSEVPVVVVFSSTWCGPCKVLKSTLSEIISELQCSTDIKKIKFIAIDVDEHPELCTTYQVKSIPNILIFNNKEIKENIKGVLSKNSLLELINKYI